MIYINHSSSLQEVSTSIQKSSWVGVDTEADSLHHYFEKLCLLQLTTQDGDFVIDTLAPIEGIQELIISLNGKELILQGADFDIRTLKKFTSNRFAPVKIFDTMIAAQILGVDRFGLADLAKRYCDVVLCKDNQTADWSRRPLNAEMLEYAANDTRYLKPICESLKEELRKVGRLAWTEQSCQKLLLSIESGTRVSKNDAAEAWRIRGSKDLNDRALTFLRELWHWREGEARRLDRPSFKVVNPDTLLDIASWAAACDWNAAVHVSDMPRAPRNVRGDYANAIDEILLRAAQLPPTAPLAKKRDFDSRKMTSREGQILKDLKTARESLSKELGIQPGVLFNNATLEQLVLSGLKDADSIKALDFLMPWQAELFIERLLPILNPKNPSENGSPPDLFQG